MKLSFLAGIVWGMAPLLWAVQEPVVTLEFVQTVRPTSFGPLMRVAVSNETYTPLNLVERVVSSELIVDGKSFKRKEAAFRGPAGLPAMGHWETCFLIDEFDGVISPGKHRVTFKLGTASSVETSIAWPPPVNWRAGNLKSRMKEVQAMADALGKGIPRSCVEKWLPLPDGGEQEGNQTRYFLEPFIKVLVPYARGEGAGLNDDVVNGPAKVYQEPHFKD